MARNNEVRRFVMSYERITLQMYKDLPRIANVVLHLNKKHRIQKIIYNN